MKIKDNIIENYSKSFLIAEVGLSHDGSLGIAKSFIDKAKACGADAIKFQMHLPEFESSKFESFRIKFSFQDKNRYDYWKRTSFKLNEWKILKKYSEKKKIIFLCSPFSIESVDHLIKLKIDAWKIASGEINNYIMLDHIIKKSNKPIILSTGLSDNLEIKKTINFINTLLKKKKKNKLAILQCTSEYPTPLSNVGHKLIAKFKNKFGLLIGLSDHSGNLNSLISGITMGAKILEFHVTYDRNFYGPDTSSSITFDELKLLSNFNDDYQKILNSKFKDKKISNNINKLKKNFHKSLALRNNKKKGDILSLKDLIALKPNIGIPSSEYKSVVGKKLLINIKKNIFLKRNHIK